jgi:D-alanyl-D-alanine carboxypeptidase
LYPSTPVLVHEADFENDDFVYEPKAPNITATHYLVADIKNNAILASSDLEAEAPIASITKLMTALVAAEHINLDKDVYLYQEQYVTTLIPRLQGRYQASMYSLLQLLLVESSNEAAEVIATQVGRERFIELMNEKALALGLVHTTFTDPSGLDDGNISTVSDLLRLIQYIHHNRSFILELTHDQDLPTAYASGQFGELENFNTIEDIDSFIGGKIGETEAAGQTSVSLHQLNINGTERIIAVIILDSDARDDDVKQLLQYVETQFVR